MTKAERLKRMLNPARAAWFGGGGIAPSIEYMRANGFTGEAVAVNPKRAEIAGLPCVPSVAELPWAPDLAILVIPKEAVIGTVRFLSERGCGGVVCITSGFSESADGAARQAELIEAAGDMPVIGPNCPGIANFLDGSAFMMDHFGNHAPDRGVAVISNGGAYLSDLGCADRSQPIAYMIGLGNQAMVSVADMLDAVLDDSRVTAVNVYFEGIADIAKLSRAAAKAARKGIPVVAIKGGRSAAGTRAAQSHTASLSGDAEVASALFRRFGWIEVTTPSEAIETVKMLSFTPVPKGVKTGFVTSSGSYAVLGGDLAEKAGLQMVPPSAEAALAIDAALPAYVGPANPLDISDAHGWPQADQLPIYQAFAQDDYDLFVQVMCYPPEGGWDMSTWDATTSALAEAKGNRPAAFVNTLSEALPREARDRMIANDMAPLQGIEDGLRAAAHAAHYGAMRSGLNPESMILSDEGCIRPRVGALPRPGRADGSSPAFPPGGTLSEADAKKSLAKSGLDVPCQWVVHGPDSLPEISCTCALKAIVPGLLHKTEAGAVALNIAPENLPAEISVMAARLAEQGLEPEGFLIEEMIQNPVGELLVGIRRVPDIGLTLTLAIGGIAVELMQDTATLILPAPRAGIEAALKGLKLAPLVLGYRGRPAVDLSATLDAIEALCAFAAGNSEIEELEVNPLLLTQSRAAVADAVLTLKG
ncbi:acetate--CoA ligase family protein [Leisingera sp. D0M16]|uniref:acetate--CoA ligase family protein n=1 Tax=Leisingera coralii TaxID=3351347 RepID=UPI003B7F15AB